MNNLEFLTRRYRQIMPAPPVSYVDFPRRKILVWLQDDVCPVLHDYVQRPKFREQASWPLSALAQGAGTKARQLIDSTDKALVACAEAFHRVATLKTVRRRLEGLFPPRQSIREETVQISGYGVQQLAVEMKTISGANHMLLQIDSIGKRFWTDLVCLEDFFWPRGGCNPTIPSEHTEGEFVVALNPELHPGGDFVSRCLLRRVEVLVEILRAFFVHLCRALPNDGGLRAKQFEEEVAGCWQTLRDKAGELRQTCLQEIGQPLRDTCALLVQVYGAFQPKPDLSWLSLPEAVVNVGCASIRRQITNSHNVELVERVAKALQTLTNLYVSCEPQQTAIDEAVAAGGLVLVEDPPRLYWDGKLHEVKWNSRRKPWHFLWKLAEKGRRGAAVGEGDLYDDARSSSTMPNLASNLKQLIPPSLRRHIIPGQEPRTYRLMLEPQRVNIFKRP